MPRTKKAARVKAALRKQLVPKDLAVDDTETTFKQQVTKEVLIRRGFLHEVDDEVERRRKIDPQLNDEVERGKFLEKLDEEVERRRNGCKLVNDELEKRRKLRLRLNEQAEKWRQRNSRMLFVEKLPGDTTAEELKSFCEDIVHVSFRNAHITEPLEKKCAFLTFNSEANMEFNYERLQEKFRDQPLKLNYVGAKRAKVLNETKMLFDWTKLFVPDIPAASTIDELAIYFKTAKDITCIHSDATIMFDSEEAAEEAYAANKEIELSGLKLTVYYLKEHYLKKKNMRKELKRRRTEAVSKVHNNPNREENSTKKIKLSEHAQSEEEMPESSKLSEHSQSEDEMLESSKLTEHSQSEDKMLESSKLSEHTKSEEEMLESSD